LQVTFAIISRDIQHAERQSFSVTGPYGPESTKKPREIGGHFDNVTLWAFDELFEAVASRA
jgi:hypothetical protein